jgi:tRNA(fMet)-specific endonuclease VapC
LRYLLDTNVCIQHLRGHAGVQARVAAVPRESLLVCSVVCFELYFGALNAREPAAATAKVMAFLSGLESLSFDDRAAEVAARLRLRLGKVGMLIGPLDLQIASIALSHDVAVVTHNTTEFARISELRLEDWQG